MAASYKATETHSNDNEYHKEYVWKNIILLGILHVLSVYSIYLTIFEVKWKTLIFGMIYGFSAGVGITAGAHRLWCHRSYKAKLPLRIILCILNTMAVQTPIYDWCRDHRVHHKFTETDADPHNSKRGFFFSHMGWLLYSKHPQVLEKGKTIDFSDLMADPVVTFQKKYYIPLSFFFGFYLPTYIAITFFDETFWNALLIAGVERYVLLLHFTWLVNSAAHIYGYRPYDNTINARENWFVSMLAVGEGFHNYHHTFPWDYATSELGWFFNISTMFIDIMAFFGLAYDLKSASPKMIEEVKRKNKLLDERIETNTAKNGYTF